MFVVCGEALFDLFSGASESTGQLMFDARSGGSPFNVAIGLARLGRDSAFFGGISNDFLGQRLMAVLGEEGVATDLVVRSNAATTLSIVGVGVDGSPQYTFYGEGAADRIVGVPDLPELSDDVRGLHFGSYSIAVAPIADALAEMARRARPRCLISLDPNVRTNVEPDLDVWRARVATLAAMADVVKISMEDVEALYGDEDPEHLTRHWLDGGAGLVLVTHGGDGVLAATASVRTRVPAVEVEVVDTVGAGDTFQAALLTALDELGLADRAGLAQLDNDALGRIVGFATRASAITCSRRGADLPHRDEVGNL